MRATSAWLRPSTTTAVMTNRAFDMPEHQGSGLSYLLRDVFPMSRTRTPSAALWSRVNLPGRCWRSSRRGFKDIFGKPIRRIAGMGVTPVRTTNPRRDPKLFGTSSHDVGDFPRGEGKQPRPPEPQPFARAWIQFSMALVMVTEVNRAISPAATGRDAEDAVPLTP